MTTYKDHLFAAMAELVKDESVIPCGYNVCDAGGAGGGSFKCFPPERRQETPLAENLMTGAAIGLSLQGFIPILWIERFDFALCCLDQIVNHLDKLALLSEGVHRPVCIIRVVVGNSKTPLFTGVTHSSDYTNALREMVGFKVERLTHKALIAQQYQFASHRAKVKRESTMLIEMKDLYST